MHRRGFLTRALSAVGGAVVGRYAVELAPTMPTGVPKVAAAATNAPATLTAWGGICAPQAPLYTLPTPVASNLVRDALPRFTAVRGGIEAPTVPA